MKIIIVICFNLFALVSFAQKPVTEQEIVALALQNSAAIRASGLAVRQNQELLKSAFNIPNVDVFTGNTSHSGPDHLPSDRSLDRNSFTQKYCSKDNCKGNA